MKTSVSVTSAEGDAIHNFNEKFVGAIFVDPKNFPGVLKLTLDDGTIVCYERRTT
jgi:hypothetical protein